MARLTLSILEFWPVKRKLMSSRIYFLKFFNFFWLICSHFLGACGFVNFRLMGKATSSSRTQASAHWPNLSLSSSLGSSSSLSQNEIELSMGAKLWRVKPANYSTLLPSLSATITQSWWKRRNSLKPSPKIPRRSKSFSNSSKSKKFQVFFKSKCQIY